MTERSLATIAVLVRDYDEAIAWYVGVLGFHLVADNAMGGDKRWVVVAPARGKGAALLLAQAHSERERAGIGDQCGGRVFLFLQTDDFDRDHARMREAGVLFEEEPRVEPYAKVAVFRDLFGNRWDLLQPLPPADRA